MYAACCSLEERKDGDVSCGKNVRCLCAVKMRDEVQKPHQRVSIRGRSKHALPAGAYCIYPKLPTQKLFYGVGVDLHAAEDRLFCFLQRAPREQSMARLKRSMFAEIMAGKSR